jgi:hypothetical protein
VCVFVCSVYLSVSRSRSLLSFLSYTLFVAAYLLTHTQQAEAELAYTLEENRLRQSIRREEMEVEVIERKRQVCVCVCVCVCVSVRVCL